MKANDIEEARAGEEILDPGEEYREGFTIRTLIGAAFVGFIMMPGAIYMGLVNGLSVGNAAQWVTIILFVEIGKRAFIQLKKQELIILFWVSAGLITVGAKLGSAVAIFGGPIGSSIWDQYLTSSPQAKAFGIAHIIPRWYSPPEGHPALLNRTFLDAAWLAPLLLLIFHLIMSKVVHLSGGYFFYRVTRDIERLPYPMAPVNSAAATALAETSSKTETWRWRVFSIGAMIGIAWGAIYNILPVVTGVLLPSPLMIIPIPYIDLTDKIGGILPAASFGIYTDLGIILSGFVLPFWVVVGSFIGAFMADIVLGPVFYNLGVIRRWTEGMDVIQLRIATTFDLWLSVIMGLAVVVAIVGIGGVIVRIVSKTRELRRKRGQQNVEEPQDPATRGRGDIPIKLAAGIWAFAVLCYVALVHFLVPTFSIWLLLFFAFIWSPLISYITARMVALTGSVQGVSFPYIKEGSYILSGYRGVSIWFAPVPLFNVGNDAQTFVQLELTRTKFVSHVKATFVTLALLLLCSFIYWSVIWKMQPIPHSAYPYVQKFWPLFAFDTCLWVSSTLGEGKNWLLSAFRPDILLYSMGVGMALYGIIWIFGLPMMLFYGMVGGVTLWIHRAIPMIIGALLSRYYFSRKFGQKQWRSYAPVLLAGFGCGMGLVAIGSAGVALIANQISSIVF